MPVGWNGADPTEVVDADNYALGTAYKANQDITITHVRVWAGATEVNLSGRTGKIWSTGGAELASVALPTDLPTGWSTHELSAPVERLALQQWVVSYDTGGNYGFVNHGLDADVVSADGAVTALGFANAPGSQNGRFHVTPGEFPASGNAQRAFYGVDVAYTLGIGGNTAPTITAASVAADGASATAVITATDDETLTGGTYRFDFGDGSVPSQTSHPTNSASHTYAASGIYPVLLSVTDADAASDYVARYVEITIPADATSGVDGERILAAALDHAKRLGIFDGFAQHEPENPPTGMSYALWVDRIDPIPERSGLSATAMRFALMARLYKPMPGGARDDIDPAIVKAIDALLRVYNADFTLGGLVSHVDIEGAYGLPMRAEGGFLQQAEVPYRVMTLVLPLIVNDAYPQEA